jgi:hypothetical protein
VVDNHVKIEERDMLMSMDTVIIKTAIIELNVACLIA